MPKKYKGRKNSRANDNRYQLPPYSNTAKKTSKASDVKVSEVLDRVLNLSESELLKIDGDAQSRFREHPELIISDVENIRRFQNETGQQVLNFDLNTVDGFNQAVEIYKMLLEVT